jgi:NTP pyrophosphatase (non-canonical NTP hydrolase)
VTAVDHYGIATCGCTNAHVLNDIADRCLANSKRWFPDPHTRGPEHAVIHMDLGITGEIGELFAETLALISAGAKVGETIKKEHRFGGLPEAAKFGEELVDVLTYVLNLAALLDIDLGQVLEGKAQECERRYQLRLDEIQLAKSVASMDPPKVVDLMADLEASIKAAQQRRADR